MLKNIRIWGVVRISCFPGKIIVSSYLAIQNYKRLSMAKTAINSQKTNCAKAFIVHDDG